MFIFLTIISIFTVFYCIYFSNKVSAKQIIILKDDNTVITNEQSLGEILLQPSIKDKKVCVISIVGFSSEGKTFFLNFLINQLKLKYNSKRWFTFGNGFSDFQWKNQAGIMMWSEVFQIKLPTGEEVAVVLLDTQTTTKEQFSTVFALTTLISSVLIISHKDDQSQYDFEHLECFSGFGEQNEDTNGPPFQKLYLLVTDWPNSHEFEYGLNGGQNLLGQQKHDFVSLFENVQCCLLPHLRNGVATDNKKVDINPKFLQHVEKVVSDILSPTKLQSKKVNQDEVTCSDLITYIESYTQYFFSGRVPSVKIMHMASAEGRLKIVSRQAESLYRTAMDNIINSKDNLKTEILEEHHLEAKQKAVEYYNNKEVLGNDQLKVEYKQFLQEKIEQRYLAYRKSNRVKLQSRLDKEKSEKKEEKEMERKLRELRQNLVDLEREFLRSQEKFQSEIQILKQQRTRQEAIQKADQDKNDGRMKILEKRLDGLQNLLEKYLVKKNYDSGDDEMQRAIVESLKEATKRRSEFFTNVRRRY